MVDRPPDIVGGHCFSCKPHYKNTKHCTLRRRFASHPGSAFTDTRDEKRYSGKRYNKKCVTHQFTLTMSLNHLTPNEQARFSSVRVKWGPAMYIEERATRECVVFAVKVSYMAVEFILLR